MIAPIVTPHATIPGRYVVGHPHYYGAQLFETCDFKSEAEALKAWKIWHSHPRIKLGFRDRLHEPGHQDSIRYGTCEQCLTDAAWHLPQQVGWHGKTVCCTRPKLEACGMNLCQACFNVHQKSIAAGLMPTDEIPFDLTA